MRVCGVNHRQAVAATGPVGRLMETKLHKIINDNVFYAGRVSTMTWLNDDRSRYVLSDNKDTCKEDRDETNRSRVGTGKTSSGLTTETTRHYRFESLLYADVADRSFEYWPEVRERKENMYRILLLSLLLC